MADGKLYGVVSTTNYVNTFEGAGLYGGKVKRQGTESAGHGFIMDAIDIDWGNLKVKKYYTDGTATYVLSSAAHSQNDLISGIKSTGHLLEIIDSNFDSIKTYVDNKADHTFTSTYYSNTKTLELGSTIVS